MLPLVDDPQAASGSLLGKGWTKTALNILQVLIINSIKLKQGKDGTDILYQ